MTATPQLEQSISLLNSGQDAHVTAVTGFLARLDDRLRSLELLKSFADELKTMMLRLLKDFHESGEFAD